MKKLIFLLLFGFNNQPLWSMDEQERPDIIAALSMNKDETFECYCQFPREYLAYTPSAVCATCGGLLFCPITVAACGKTGALVLLAGSIGSIFCTGVGIMTAVAIVHNRRSGTQRDIRYAIINNNDRKALILRASD